jgi:two-component system NtrC family sensor kinase
MPHRDGPSSLDEGIGGAGFAAIVRAALEAVIVADDGGRVLEFNPAAERMFGWSRAEAMGQEIGTLIVPPHLRARHERGMERMRAGAPPRMTEREVEMEALHRDGRVFPCALSVARLEPPNDSLFAASIRDLSELKAEQNTRREVESLLRAVFDDQTEVIFRYDAAGRIVFYNLAAQRFYGVTETAMLGQHILDDISPSLRDRVAAELAGLTVDNPVVTGTDPKVKLNGETRWFAWTNRALFDAAGRLTGYQSVGRDVTEQHIARMELAASEARFAAFMRHAPVGMYVKDAEGRYTSVNPEMERVLGRPAADLIGRSARDFLPEALVAVIEAADAEVRRTGRPTAIEERIEGADSYEWTLVVRFPIEPPGGGAAQIGGFDIDITAIRRAQAELERMREALHQNDKLSALGHFAAAVAHELNNPLTIILGQAALLGEDLGASPLAARVDMIARAAARCNAVFRNALATARGEPPARRPADMNALVAGAVEAAGLTRPGNAPRVVMQLARRLPRVFCDPGQMHQVILNLLTNAREALDGRGGTGTIRVTTARLAEAALSVEVQDDGPGVPDHLRTRIFEPYFTTKPVGTGIGLALCRAVVEAHEGAIDLLPAGAGARFRIILPVGRGSRRSGQRRPRPRTGRPRVPLSAAAGDPA